MEIIVATVMFLLSGGMLSGSVILYRKKAKPKPIAERKETAAPKRISKSPPRLAPGFDLRVEPTSSSLKPFGNLDYIAIVDTSTGYSVSASKGSWESERASDIQSLLRDATYQKKLKARAKERAKRTPVHKIELRVDGSEVDRMKVDANGELVIPPVRTFDLPRVPPLLRWSIRGERGRSLLSLSYVGSASSPQILCEKGLPETGNPKKNILEAAIDLLAQTDVEYGENLDVFVSKTNSIYSDYEGEW